MLARHRVHAVFLAVLVLLLAGCGGGSDDKADGEPAGTTSTASGGSDSGSSDNSVQLGPAFGSMTSLPGVLKSGPPWGANAGKLQLRLRAIGLDPLTQEGQVVHIHQHLDIFVDGKKVTVPANLGIDPSGGFISDLHTHDESGIMHVESPTPSSFSLGQFFAVWGVPLSATCIGNRCDSGSKKLRTWVNGKPVTADPTRIVLDAHQEIVLAYGTPAQMPDPVPSSYTFPEGL